MKQITKLQKLRFLNEFIAKLRKERNYYLFICNAFSFWVRYLRKDITRKASFELMDHLKEDSFKELFPELHELIMTVGAELEGGEYFWGSPWDDTKANLNKPNENDFKADKLQELHDKIKSS